MSYRPFMSAMPEMDMRSSLNGVPTGIGLSGQSGFMDVIAQAVNVCG